MLLRKMGVAVAVSVAVAACGTAESGSKSTTTPAGSGGAGNEFPESVGAARTDFDKQANAVELSSADCQAACKALASLERAANRLCLVAEPQECSEARVRYDRARRAVMAQCGGC
jgi:hypothetical protein